jgi:hypothetical protein
MMINYNEPDDMAYIKSIEREIASAELNGRKSIYRNNEQLGVNGYRIIRKLTDYFRNTKYAVETKMCKKCEHTWDIIITWKTS